MLNRVKNFIYRHYLVTTYCVLAFAFVLFVVFRNDLTFLLQLIAALIVIVLYAIAGSFVYIIVRAIFADHAFESKIFRTFCLVVLALVVFFFVLRRFVFPSETENLVLIYELAPLASWPAILSVLVLNIFTKWNKVRGRGQEGDLDPNLPKDKRHCDPC